MYGNCDILYDRLITKIEWNRDIVEHSPSAITDAQKWSEKKRSNIKTKKEQKLEAKFYNYSFVML